MGPAQAHAAWVIYKTCMVHTFFNIYFHVFFKNKMPRTKFGKTIPPPPFQTAAAASATLQTNSCSNNGKKTAPALRTYAPGYTCR
jgi:hypothetical protein